MNWGIVDVDTRVMPRIRLGDLSRFELGRFVIEPLKASLGSKQVGGWEDMVKDESLVDAGVWVVVRKM